MTGRGSGLRGFFAPRTGSGYDRVAVSGPLSRCALAAILLGGCGGATSQLREENRRLDAKVAELRAQTRRQRRTVQDLRNQVALLRDRASHRPAPADVPELPVEVRRPESSGDSPAAVRSGATGSGRGEGEGGDDEVIYLTNIGDRGHEPAIPPERRSRARRRRVASEGPTSRRAAGDKLPEMQGSVPTVDSQIGARSRSSGRADPRRAYRRYYDALKAGNHAYAIAGFGNFLDAHPDHAYADNAQYWLAEAHYDQDAFETALAEFRRVVAEHGGGNKVPAAMLKIGYCHVQLGDEAAARRALERVVERYPDTNPARLAADRLESLGP